MKKDCGMYRYYKGESENPYNHETQGTAHMFWFYESIFERDFIEMESSDWYDFLTKQGLGEKFMAILTEEDYARPVAEKKKQVFELWLDYFFRNKLYAEYGGENYYKTAYYASPVQQLG